MNNLKSILKLIILLCFWGNVQSQDSTLNLKLIKKIHGKYSTFTTDNLGNIMLATANNELIAYNNKYDSVATYKNISAGNLSLIDASNPLQILVYYNESNTIILLDRQLNLINTIVLTQFNIQKVNAVTRSYDNNYWLFDEWDNKLKKMDDNGTILSESTDFRLILDSAYSPEKIIDNNGSLYLYNSALGWLVFDYYLGLKKQYPYLGWRDVWVEDKFLKGIVKEKIIMAYPKELIYQHLILPYKAINEIKIICNHNNIFSLEKEGLNIYSIQQ